jgi:hypothetical protein
MKTLIRRAIGGLPFGERHVVPALKFLREKVSYRYINYHLEKRRAEKNGAVVIERMCREGEFDEALIVFDMQPSPPNFGVLFYMAMLARFFWIQQKRVQFVFIDSEFRDDWSPLSLAERSSLVSDFAEIPRVLLGDGGDEIQIQSMSWDGFSSFLRGIEKEDAIFVPFKDRIRKRESVYDLCFNVINRLFSVSVAGLTGKFLLSFKEIASAVEIKIPVQPYITWHVRHSDKWRFESDCTEEEFITTYAELRALYRDRKIMLISDQKGCDFFRCLASRYHLDLLFSKDFSNTFMGDCALILGSQFFFALRGGGIGVCPLYSTVPYGMILKLGNETEWSTARLTPWATNRQIFKSATMGSPKDVHFLYA